MDGRGAARRGPGGGGGIQALRPTRARVVAGIAALATVAVLGVYPPLLAGSAGTLLAAPAAVAAAAVLAALVLRWEFAAVCAVALLGGAYVGALFLREESALDPRAPLYAVLLALLPELVAWSTQSALPLPVEPAVHRARLVTLVCTLLAGLGAGALVVAVADVGGGGGLAWEAVGAAAAVAAVGLLVALGGRSVRA